MWMTSPRCRSPLEGITEADHSNDALLANQLESRAREPRFTVSGNGIEKNEPAKLNVVSTGAQRRW